MAKIYRIEHKETFDGPYQYGEIPIDRSAKEHQPSPYSDFGFGSVPYKSPLYRFGCLSLEDSLTWFYNELEMLKEHNFVLNVYEVHEGYVFPSESKRQCIFKYIFDEPIKPVENIPL